MKYFISIALFALVVGTSTFFFLNRVIPPMFEVGTCISDGKVEYLINNFLEEQYAVTVVGITNPMLKPLAPMLIGTSGTTPRDRIEKDPSVLAISCPGGSE